MTQPAHDVGAIVRLVGVQGIDTVPVSEEDGTGAKRDSGESGRRVGKLAGEHAVVQFAEV